LDPRARRPGGLIPAPVVLPPNDRLENAGQAILVRDGSVAEEWDELAGRVPWATPQHYFAWGASLSSSFGYLKIAHRLFCIRDEVVAGLPLIRLSTIAPFTGLYSQVFHSYGGPLIRPDYLGDENLLRRISDEIDRLAVRHRAFEVRILIPPHAPKAVARCLLAGDRTQAFPRLCVVMALDRPLDRIVHGYRSSVRRAVMRSLRRGVVVETADAHLARRAFPIYQATMERVGGTAKPWRFIESLVRQGIAVPFVARHGSRLIGVVILLVSPRAAIYWISAAVPEASECRPTNALVDHAIRWCHDRGIPRFDFTTTIRQERPGLTRFKSQWGGTSLESPLVVRTYRPRIQRVWSSIEPAARRTYAAWDRWRASLSR